MPQRPPVLDGAPSLHPIFRMWRQACKELCLGRHPDSVTVICHWRRHSKPALCRTGRHTARKAWAHPRQADPSMDWRCRKPSLKLRSSSDILKNQGAPSVTRNCPDCVQCDRAVRLPVPDAMHLFTPTILPVWSHKAALEEAAPATSSGTASQALQFPVCRCLCAPENSSDLRLDIAKLSTPGCCSTQGGQCRNFSRVLLRSASKQNEGEREGKRKKEIKKRKLKKKRDRKKHRKS